MYDREVISRSIVSPIGSGATYEEVRDSIIEGFEQKVRSIVVNLSETWHSERERKHL